MSLRRKVQLGNQERDQEIRLGTEFENDPEAEVGTENQNGYFVASQDRTMRRHLQKVPGE